jgi:hypothetical protein
MEVKLGPAAPVVEPDTKPDTLPDTRPEPTRRREPNPVTQPPPRPIHRPGPGPERAPLYPGVCPVEDKSILAENCLPKLLVVSENK